MATSSSSSSFLRPKFVLTRLSTTEVRRKRPRRSRNRPRPPSDTDTPVGCTGRFAVRISSDSGPVAVAVVVVDDGGGGGDGVVAATRTRLPDTFGLEV